MVKYTVCGYFTAWNISSGAAAELVLHLAPLDTKEWCTLESIANSEKPALCVSKVTLVIASNLVLVNKLRQESAVQHIN